MPDDLRDPAVSTSTFGQSLKTFFLCLSAHLVHWGVSCYAIYKCTILTYFRAGGFVRSGYRAALHAPTSFILRLLWVWLFDNGHPSHMSAITKMYRIKIEGVQRHAACATLNDWSHSKSIDTANVITSPSPTQCGNHWRSAGSILNCPYYIK